MKLRETGRSLQRRIEWPTGRRHKPDCKSKAVSACNNAVRKGRCLLARLLSCLIAFRLPSWIAQTISFVLPESIRGCG